jgi:hypothetical protein
MSSEAYQLVRSAILAKRIIVARYNGHVREMCPHVIGYGPSGNEQALFYQFGGGSSTGIGPDGSRDNWRCIRLDGLRDIKIVDGPWHTAPNHSRPQTCVQEIDVEVDYD